MVGSGGVATRSTYRDTVGYSAIVAGRVGMYSPYRLYVYCYAPGIGLPPYRGWPARPGRTVRGTVRSNPKRSYLDSFRLFWKSRGKSTRGLRQKYKVASPGSYRSVPRTLRPWTRGTRGESAGRRLTRAMWSLAVAACNCFCVWLLRFGFCGGSCSTFEAALPLASPCQGEGDRRRRWKGGYVAESDIVVIEDRTYCFLYAAILRPSTSPPPSQLRCQPPLARGAERFEQLRNKVQSVATFTRGGKRGSALLQPTATIPTKSSIHQPNFDASETERTRTTTERVQHLTKAEHPTDASAHKQGVQGGTPWAFSVPFCAQKGTPAREGARPARTPAGRRPNRLQTCRTTDNEAQRPLTPQNRSIHPQPQTPASKRHKSAHKRPY